MTSRSQVSRKKATRNCSPFQHGISKLTPESSTFLGEGRAVPGSSGTKSLDLPHTAIAALLARRATAPGLLRSDDTARQSLVLRSCCILTIGCLARAGMFRVSDETNWLLRCPARSFQRSDAPPSRPPPPALRQEPTTRQRASASSIGVAASSSMGALMTPPARRPRCEPGA